MRVALYARVSTSDQDPEPQLRELRSHCKRQGWDISATYTDVISGTKTKRPQLDRLMSAARQRKFDAVCVWKLDRFGRSLPDCLNRIEGLDGWGIRFIATTQAIDTDQRNPASRFMLQVLGVASRPPVFISRCCKLVSDQLLIRCGNPSRRQRLPRL